MTSTIWKKLIATHARDNVNLVDPGKSHGQVAEAQTS